MNSKISSMSLLIISSVVVTGALVYTKTILIPFVFSLFIYAVISTYADFIQNKLKIPKAVALTLIILVALSFFVGLFLAIIFSLNNFLQETTIYQTKIVQAGDWFAREIQSYGYNFDKNILLEEIKNFPVFSVARDVSGGVFSLVGNFFLILIFTLFLLLGEGSGSHKILLWEEVKEKISKYLLVKIITSSVTAILVVLLLSLCGSDLAFMFGILTFLLNFIPNVGSLIATALPLPVLFLQFGLNGEFWAFTIGAAAIQFIIGNIIEPKFVGESVGLHPLVILLFLMFWGLVWGIPGMFLAVPITALLKIILGKITATKKLSELLAGRL